MKRNYNLDKWRGFTIISMVLFHLMYNINYYWHISWYENPIVNRIWQLSIATSFFIISGITSNMLSPRENIIRGIKTSLIGFAITLITYIAAPDQFILWGVLNGLGASMIITGLIDTKNKNGYSYTFIFILMFVLTYRVPRGYYYNFGIFKVLHDMNLFPLGFPARSFRSTDYFPIIPWSFLYLAGFYLGKYLISKDFYDKYGSDSKLAKIGRNSLKIYLAHQVILYPLVTFIYMLTK